MKQLAVLLLAALLLAGCSRVIVSKQGEAPPPREDGIPADPGLTGVKLGEAVIDAKEMQALQASVDNGHQPWRLDPQQVALQEGALFGLDPARGVRFQLIDRGEARAVIEAEANGQRYQLILIQPVKAGGAGIWTISEVQPVQ